MQGSVLLNISVRLKQHHIGDQIYSRHWYQISLTLLRYSSPTQPEQVLGYVPLDIALLDMDVQQNSL